MKPRFCIGIDLGTTNCALSYIDNYEATPTARVLPIEQEMQAGRFSKLDLLPSFLSWKHQTGNQKKTAWILGAWARETDSEQSELVVQSAKSWLCHRIIDSDAAVLPWQSSSVPDTDKSRQ
jgi:molecular chaperone DnaK (HSP70)